MKHPAAYYLFLLYCTLMVRCAMPVACDALSHLFNEEAHIATVHAVYGSHHLQTEVAGAVSDDHTSKHTNTQTYEPTVVHTYTSGYNAISISSSLLLTQFSSHSYPLCRGSLFYKSEPPESC